MHFNIKAIPKLVKIGSRDYGSEERVLVTPIDECKRFIKDLLYTKNTKKEYAEIVADNLLEADHRGHVTHGLIRVEKYLDSIEKNIMQQNNFPEIKKETAATAWVNGNNGLGAVIGKFCMELAMKKAKEVGTGLVLSKGGSINDGYKCYSIPFQIHDNNHFRVSFFVGSNHYGVCSDYVERAIKEGLIGLTFSNTSPCSVPIRAKDAALGTLPFALGAPALNGDSLVVDVATTAAALGKIVLAHRKGVPIPKGWALNDKGEVTTDPGEALKKVRLLPVGGTESTGGVKGYALQMMVETFCGILSGSNYGPKIPFWGGPDVREANLGQSFLAIDPKQFAENFEERLSEFLNILRNMPPIDKSKPVMVPGDMERKNKKMVDAQGGIVYLPAILKVYQGFADKYKVEPMKSIEKSKVVAVNSN